MSLKAADIRVLKTMLGSRDTHIYTYIHIDCLSKKTAMFLINSGGALLYNVLT